MRRSKVLKEGYDLYPSLRTLNLRTGALLEARAERFVGTRLYEFKLELLKSCGYYGDAAIPLLEKLPDKW